MKNGKCMMCVDKDYLPVHAVAAAAVVIVVVVAVVGIVKLVGLDVTIKYHESRL
jgi:hypothetical protein